MERMTKDVSLALIKFERENACKIPEHYSTLIDWAEKMIEADLITYEDYVQDVATEFEKATANTDNDASLEERVKAIEVMCSNLSKIYEEKLNGRKEVRSEQSEDGPSAA